MCNWAAWLHHVLCHYQTLLICSNAFLKLRVRLNVFSMCLLPSAFPLHVAAFLMFTWHQRARDSKRTSKNQPKARQAPLRVYISLENSRSLGWNTSRYLQSYAPEESILLTSLIYDGKAVLAWAPLLSRVSKPLPPRSFWEVTVL